MLRLPSARAQEAAEDDWERACPAESQSQSSSDCQRQRQSQSESALEVEGALRSMRLARPPATDNGGAFEAAGGDLGSVSPAAASAASAAGGPLDPVLVSCLENPRERLSMLKFEDQIVRFLRNPRCALRALAGRARARKAFRMVGADAQSAYAERRSSASRPCPPTTGSSFTAWPRGASSTTKRPTTIRTRYASTLSKTARVQSLTAEMSPQSGNDGNAARVVTLFKTAQSAVPAVLLINLSSDRQHPTVTPASAPRIMVRKRNAQRPGANGGRGSGGGKDGSKAARSMQDRERAYAEARARIFGEDSSTESSSAPSPDAPPSAAGPTTDSANSSNANSGAEKSRNRQASGPDGLKGLTRGRGSPPGRSHGESKISARGSVQGQQRPAARSPVTDPQSWKESKVLWRNREQELNDPDFTRNHGAYRPIRTTNSSSDGLYQHSQQPQQRYGGGGSYGGRYGGEYSPHQSDRSQQGFTAPQFQAPGGGRGRYPSEYSRVDGPQQFYRGGPYQMAPPPPIAVARGFTGTYIQERSPSRSPSAIAADTQQSQNGVYNDDFPPLGR